MKKIKYDCVENENYITFVTDGETLEEIEIGTHGAPSQGRTIIGAKDLKNALEFIDYQDVENPQQVKTPFPSAIKWTGKNLREVIDLTGWNESASSKWTWAEYEQVVEEKGLKIFTPSGSVMADIGDWIIYNGKDYYVTAQKNKSATSEEVQEAIEYFEDTLQFISGEPQEKDHRLAITALQEYQPKEPCSECIKYQNDFNYCADCGRKLGD